jgi:hypothetical protein
MNETKQLYNITKACMENIQFAIEERLNNSNNPLEIEQLNDLKRDVVKTRMKVEELLKKV